MVAVAQLVERQIVALSVARSIRVGYPIYGISSAGQSSCLRSSWSGVRIPYSMPAYLSGLQTTLRNFEI